MSEQKQVEFEEVVIKLPKRVMDSLLIIQEDLVAWIEHKIVEATVNDTDYMDMIDWVKAFHLASFQRNSVDKRITWMSMQAA